MPLPGGAAAIRQPWRMAAAYLARAGVTPESLAVTARHEDQWAAVLSMARKGVNAPLTSSAGRLFDAVAALLGVRDTINYEGQAAVELEQLADPLERGSYRAGLSPGEPFLVAGADLVRAAAGDLAAAYRPRSSRRGSIMGWPRSSWMPVWSSVSGAGWTPWPCPAGCSRTCCWTETVAGWRRAASGS